MKTFRIIFSLAIFSFSLIGYADLQVEGPGALEGPGAPLGMEGPLDPSWPTDPQGPADPPLPDPKTGREYVSTLTVSNDGPWGYWGFKDFCPEGSYAIGYEMKIERPQCGGDDTSLNGVRLICGSKTGIPDGSYATSSIGPWGDWKGEVRCLHGQVIARFKLQVERPQGRGDDTAANSMMVQCRIFATSDGLNDRKMGSGLGFWGTYGDWSNGCPENTAVCGIQTKIESPQGRGDDTALNSVRLFCCE